MKTLAGGERELISRIEKRLPSRAGGFLRLGIGDDAALLRARAGREIVLTCDFLLEGRHFLLGSHSNDSADAIGWKSLARATSDIAAMGGVPRCFLLSLALPRKLTGAWLDAFLGGMARAARKFGMLAAGGDTTVHEKVMVNMTVVGEVRAGRAITRTGARPGDLIYVSGRLGEAHRGLEVIRQGLQRQKRWKRVVRKHLYPEPRLALGQWLAEWRLATAMIDTSDGLSSDLANLCAASGVGARIFAEKIPGVSLPPGNSGRNSRKGTASLRFELRGVDPLELALHGGEDYELLFTVPPNVAKGVPREYREGPLTAIGEITREKNITIINRDGGVQPLMARGWDPFRSCNRIAPAFIEPR